MKYSYKGQQVSLTWKKDSGEGDYTEDAYLWINGNPSQICISGAECGEYGVLIYDKKELYMADTRKELKEALFEEEIIPYLEKEIDLYLD